MNKLILAAVILAVLIGGTYYFYNGKTAPNTNYAVDPLNATYTFAPNGGEPNTLSGGVLSIEAAPGSASKEIIRIFGEPAIGDLNGDGKTDAASFIEDQTAGTGTFYYVAAAINTGSATQGTNAILLGDRIAPQNISITNGKILVNYADRKPGEPMVAQPSVGVSKYFKIQNGTLTEVNP